MENWQIVCQLEDIAPNMGGCVLVDGDQIAIFRCARTHSLYAVSNYDPIDRANILSRGIIGSIEAQPYVASPLYKQHFNLLTGQCFEVPEVTLTVYQVREHDGFVQVLVKRALAA